MLKNVFYYLFTKFYLQLSAEAEGRPWTPTPSVRSGKTQSSTRSLATTRFNSSTQRSASSLSMSGGFDQHEEQQPVTDRKARNEQYFAQLGSANETRSE